MPKVLYPRGRDESIAENRYMQYEIHSRHMKNLLVIFFVALFFSCLAQKKLNFSFRLYKTTPLTQASIHLKSSRIDVELFNSETSNFNDTTFVIESNFDTILEFNKTFDLPLLKDDYELNLSFKNEKNGSRKLDYDFTIDGNESEVEIIVGLNIFEKPGKDVINHHGTVEVLKYLQSNHGIKVSYSPDVQESQPNRDPFFEVQNNSKDTLCFNKQSLSSSSPLQKTIDNHTFDYSGGTDYSIRKTPLLPDSTIKIPLTNMYWRLDWPKERYSYTLFYYTKEKQSVGVTKLLEDPDFIFYGSTKKYFRFTYTFDMQ